MRTLSVDIETFASVDLRRAGAYRYAEAPDFEIILFAYAYDADPVKVIDMTKEELPRHLIEDLADPGILKTAFNASFEIACLRQVYGSGIKTEQWEDTMVLARMMGLPGSLAGAAEAIGTVPKDSAGTLLINYFCKPCKPTKANEGRTRNLPEHSPEKWEQFKAYNLRDVETERELRLKLKSFKVGQPSPYERDIWLIDQEINTQGILCDVDFAARAIEASDIEVSRLKAEMTAISGVANPNSDAQIKEWLGLMGLDAPSLNKDVIGELIGQTDDPDILKVIDLRSQMKRSSVKKYQAMLDSVSADGRCRGMFLYYGANRTGRWSGQRVQLQNLRRNALDNLDLARELTAEGKYDELAFMFSESPQDVLSQLIRTAFIAPEGYRFAVADFSAIEARVIAWLAGERWRMDVFASHGKIYEASASHMFGVPIEDIGKGSPLRQKGKVAELALGYGGGAGALVRMGALDMGLKEDELEPLKKAWRRASPRIVGLWHDVDGIASDAVAGEGRQQLRYGISARVTQGILAITLPSGRELCYMEPTFVPGEYGDELAFMGVDQERKTWGRIRTYGAKLVENIVQAIARDCLAEAIIRLHRAGYKIVAHVHDEIIAEVPEENNKLDEMIELMTKPISWAPGLKLGADGYFCKYYQKD